MRKVRGRNGEGRDSEAAPFSPWVLRCRVARALLAGTLVEIIIRTPGCSSNLSSSTEVFLPRNKEHPGFQGQRPRDGVHVDPKLSGLRRPPGPSQRVLR